MRKFSLILFLLFFIFLHSSANDYRTEYLIGKKYFDKQNYDSALYYFSQIIISNQNIESNYLINTNMKIAYIYYIKGQYYKSLYYFKKSEEIDITNNIYTSSSEKNYLYNFISLILKNLKKYKEALEYTNKIKSLNIDQSTNYEEILVNEGILYYRLKKYDNSIEVLKESLKTGTEYILYSYLFIANSYYELKNFQDAENYYKKAIEAIENSNSDDFKIIAEIYLHYGIFLKEVNNCGLDFLEKSIKISKTANLSKDEIIILAYKHISDYYFNNQQFDKALENIQQALIYSHSNFTETDWKQNPENFDTFSEIYLLYSLQSKADLLYKISEFKPDSSQCLLEKSFVTYKLTMDLISITNNNYLNNEDKQSLSKETKALYNNAIEVAFNLYLLTDNYEYLKNAYEISEKTKSTILENILLENELIFYSVNNTELYDRLIELYENLYDLKTSGNNNSDEFFEISRRYNNLLDSVRDDNFKSLIGNIQNQNNYDEFYKNIDKNLNFIQYYVSDTVVFTFVANKNGLYANRFQRDSSFNNSLEIVLEHYEKFKSYDLNQLNQYYFSLYVLYQKLIFPVEKYLNSDNICIIPDEELYLLSFENLISNYNKKSLFEYGKSEYLVEKYNISYHFSSFLKDFKYSERIKPKNQIIAIAPEYNFSGIQLKNDLSQNRSFKAYSYLTGAVNEVRQINSITGADTIIGNFLTFNALKSNISKYRIIHFASHSFTDLENPEFSGLILGLDTLKNEIDILRNYQIRNMNLNCEMVVLSGCNTGVGEIISGEGVLSIARNFYIAGSSTIITSLWNVSDFSTSKIITFFYQFLDEGYTAGEALKLAKLEYLKNSDPDSSNPVYWAGLILIGDEDFKLQKTENNIAIIVLISLTIILMFAVIKNYFGKKKRKNL